MYIPKGNRTRDLLLIMETSYHTPKQLATLTNPRGLLSCVHGLLSEPLLSKPTFPHYYEGLLSVPFEKKPAACFCRLCRTWSQKIRRWWSFLSRNARDMVGKFSKRKPGLVRPYGFLGLPRMCSDGETTEFTFT